MRPSAHAPRHRLPAAAAAFVTTLMALPVSAGITLPEVPLQTSATVSPNIMFILDDSGSMHYEIVPDGTRFAGQTNGDVRFVFPRADKVYGEKDYTNNVATVDDTTAYAALTRSPQSNPIYYNPGITYQPWSKADGSAYPNASATCALHNPEKAGTGRDYCLDLTDDEATNYNDNRWRTCYDTSSGSCSSSTSSLEYLPATYYWKSSTSSDPWDRDSYTKIEIVSGKSYTGHGRKARTDCALAASETCTYAEEIQNFANWYTYYRSRVLTARAGIGRAFAKLPSDSAASAPRVGYAAINQGETEVDGVSTGTVVSGVRAFTGSDREAWFENLYQRDIPNAGTPLRAALDDVGQYYRRSDNSGPWAKTPGGSDSTAHLACRQSYAILMTDGYWNGDAASGSAADNNDGSAGSEITGANNAKYTYQPVSPFKDDYSDTLADVAMYYWKNDLRDLDNQVPATSFNPAFWQHMVTYGVGLGVTGAIDPDTAFAAIGSNSNSINWPDPTSSEPAKLDDLLHAAVNSRGGFFTASDPDSFAQGLNQVLSSIIERTASGSNVSANSVSLGTDTKVFQASYVSGQWTGELAAYAVTSSGLASTPSWRASQKLPTAANRTIYTHKSTATPKGVLFTWANLTSSQQTALGSSDVLDYLRGVTSKERQNGGSYRNRSHALGDIVYSSPAYSAESDTVFVGANDGMLHAFDAKTGVERFAYVPASLDWSKLKNLSSPTYTHNFFVDGPVTISDKATTPAKNYLVGTLGRGGKGVYALDVTTPASFSGTDVLWEYKDTGTAGVHMGYVLSRPIIARLNDGSTAAIVANGPNSTNGDAALFMINLTDGSVIAHLPVGKTGDNGLSAPRGWDSDGNGTLDYVYAGDLKGNLWKFDLSNKDEKKWAVANSGKPLFEAQDAAGKAQPISGGVSLAMDPNSYKLWVFFGTGRFLTTADPAETATQSWYGLIDEGSAIEGKRSDAKFKLKERKIVVTGEVDVKDSSGKVVGKRKVRAFEEATGGDMSGKQGWYVDLTMPPAKAGDPRIQEGERMVGQPSVVGGVLMASSIIPSTDVCVGGGRGYLNAIDPFTGARTRNGFFDANNDGVINDGDTIKDEDGEGAVIGSVDLDVAMPTDPALVDDRAVVGGSDGRRRDIKTNNPAQVGRISWRELIQD